MTVYTNNRGKWCVDVEWVHPDGRVERIRKTSPKQTKRDAEKYEREMRDSLANGTYGKRQATTEETPTVDEYRERFIKLYQAKGSRATSVRNVVSVFKKHLSPLFGKRPMDDFKPKDRNTLITQFAGHRTHARYNNTVAVINGLIETYHAESERPGKPFRFTRMKYKGQRKDFYDFEKLLALIESARRISLTAELIVLLGSDAGCRRGEILGLEARHCDMPARMLNIERAEALIGKQRHMSFTKGGEPRSVDMTRRLQDAFGRHFEARGRKGRIILQDDGQPFSADSLKRLMRQIQIGAGLEPTGRVHILRHTFCSHLAIRGVPMLTIQELAGHKHINTTLGYMHLAPGETRRGIDRLEQPPPTA